MTELSLSILLVFFVVAVLLVDLGIFQKASLDVNIKQALGWTFFWIFCAFLFNALIYFYIGQKQALEFLSGFLIEKSLSVDNLFVFLLIFSYFQVPKDYQHKVLFLGILGAVIMRGILIYAGISLIERYHWLTYLLGFFLLVTGLKSIYRKEGDISLDDNRLLKFLRKILPLTVSYKGNCFWVKEGKKLFFTPLTVVLVMVETTDVIFALDSIPAILAVTTDPFVLYTSNLFAILGLRALYFVVSGLMESFKYLRYAVCWILIFVGIKMLVNDFINISEIVVLAVITSILLFSIVMSVIKKDEV